MIHGRIGREGTMLYKGTYIKDLSYLGRKIPSTIYVDFDDIVVHHHTENCIILTEWDGGVFETFWSRAFCLVFAIALA